MLRNPVFAFALLTIVTLGSIAAVAATVQQAAPSQGAEGGERVPEHIARLFAAGIVSLESLSF